MRTPKTTRGGINSPRKPTKGQPSLFALLLRDKVAVAAATVLLIVFISGLMGPFLLGDRATQQDTSMINQAPGIEGGWLYLLGTDTLGRSMLARIIVASQTTLLVVLPVVFLALVIGSLIGMWAGYHRGFRETLAMRLADIILSFPTLLLAVIVLYVFDPSIANIVLIILITRLPIYLRTSRAETAEVRSRLFVDASRSFGMPSWKILRHHVIPLILPTLMTVATLDFALVMLMESSLSFLGLGIQPPDVSWGLLIAEGRSYLQTAWWISFFPGLAIVATTVSATILSSWMRLATDPSQRWRLTLPRGKRSKKTTVTAGV